MSRKSDAEKNSLFTQGYSSIRKKMKKRSRWVMDCRSCRFFEQQEGDKYEVCQNRSVTKYDMVHTETNCYCTYWQPEGLEEAENQKPLTMEEYIRKKFGKSYKNMTRGLKK